MASLGPYSREIRLARPDGRTREARLLKAVRQELIQHLGGADNVTGPQLQLVERAAYLQLRCAALDRRVLDGTLTGYDNATYLAWSNSLRLTLSALGIVTPAPPPAAADIDPMAAIHAHLAARLSGDEAA